MTGRHVSKPIESLLEEASLLVEKGVRELLVIAQDLSFYGLDLYKEHKLAELVSGLADIKDLEWIKLHYAYPAGFPFGILPVMKERDNVARYLDIALQHISDNMLKKMRRNISKRETIELINRIREEVPGIHLRTTLLVGHPGETDSDFEELKEFVRNVRFERLGVFPYSHEEDTYAGRNYRDEIPEDIKKARADEIMEIQQSISLENCQSKVGTQIKVVIDRKDDEFFVGRTEFDSPEVDGEVYIRPGNMEPEIGSFYNVSVIKADDYDLYGVIR